MGKIIFLLLSLNIALGSFSLLFIDKDCDIVHTILLDNPAEDIMKLKTGIMGAVRFALTYLLFFLGMNINTGGNHAPDRADSIFCT